jgi:hypothetical protein
MVCDRRPWTYVRPWQGLWDLALYRRALSRLVPCDQHRRVRALAVKGARARSRIPAVVRTGAPDAAIPDVAGAGGRRTHDLSSQCGVQGVPTSAAMACARPWQGLWDLAPCRRALSRLVPCDQHRRVRAQVVKGARSRNQISVLTRMGALASATADAATLDVAGADGKRTHDLPKQRGAQGVPTVVQIQQIQKRVPTRTAMASARPWQGPWGLASCRKASVRVIEVSAPRRKQHSVQLGGSRRDARPRAVLER